MDADWSHAPFALPSLLAPIADGTADLVIGSRYVAGGRVEDWGLGRRLVSRLGSVFARSVLSLRPHDLTGGVKAWRATTLAAIPFDGVHAGGYVFQIEMTYRASLAGARIHEVPISYYARGREEGKKLTWRDGIRALGTLTRIRLASQHQLFADAGDYHRERQAELAVRRLPPLPDERPVNVVSGTRTEVQRGVSDP